MGFTLFAIEANMPEAYRVNDYVLHGKGEPKELLKGMYFWTWNTQEVLDMIHWMRQFNQSGKGRIQFLGFDMQTTNVAAEIAKGFVAKAEPDYAATLDPVFAAVGKSLEAMYKSAGGGGSGKASAQAAREAVRHLESRRAAWLERFSREEVDWAIQNARVVLQAAELVAGERSRDQSMADNVAWILEQAPAGSKIVLWAHNGHVNRRPGAMGAYLTERFGKDMVVLGFAMDRGSYTAVGGSGLSAHEALAAPAGSVESYLRTAAQPRFILDLRDISFVTPAWSWLAAERPFRAIGAMAMRCAHTPSNVAKVYDGLIYIAETTPSVLLPR
jgi:erythromycin esterase